VHCWGGRGRTGLVSACVLGALYDIDAEEALERVQRAYSLREPWRDSISPETEEQKEQVRDWFRTKRKVRCTKPAYGIWSEDGTKIVEVISPVPLPVRDNEEKDADKLGNGRFGQVFRGRCEHSAVHTPVAIKVTYNMEDAPQHEQSRLALEATVLRAMSGNRGFPRVLYDGRQSVFNKPGDVLVMQLLGRPILNRLWAKDRGDTLCKDNSFTIPAVMNIGAQILSVLRPLHDQGFMHNDLKPMNILFGAQGSGMEDHIHLVDFGMATRHNERQDDTIEGYYLQAGGASPIFANVAQLEGRPTRPVDDVESLWYILAYLIEKELPWQWEPYERLANIKRRLYQDECGISSDQCTALLSSEDCCSTSHCFRTCDQWDVPDAMHELWCHIVEGQEDEKGMIDYDACLEALSGSADITQLPPPCAKNKATTKLANDIVRLTL